MLKRAKQRTHSVARLKATQRNETNQTNKQSITKNKMGNTRNVISGSINNCNDERKIKYVKQTVNSTKKISRKERILNEQSGQNRKKKENLLFRLHAHIYLNTIL